MMVNISGSWWPYEFRLVHTSELVIERFDGDIGFQRPQSERFIERAVKEFDPRRFEPLIVVRVNMEPGELYSVIDGQHREAMAERQSLEWVPCLVLLTELSYTERSLLFHELNLRRRQLSLRDSMRARQEGKESEMMGLLAMLHRHGFYLDGHKPESVNGCRPLLARAVLDKCYKRDPRHLTMHCQCWRCGVTSWTGVCRR